MTDREADKLLEKAINKLANQSMTDHPITPPPELVKQWFQEFYSEMPICVLTPSESVCHVAIQSARWGSDQELKACVEWLREAKNHGFGYDYGAELACRLRAARRPTPPSLKDEVRDIIDCLIEGDCVNDEDALTLRRAFESLPS